MTDTDTDTDARSADIASASASSTRSRDLESRFLRFDALRNRLAESLFFVPFLLLAASIVLSQLTVQVDRRLAENVLPSWFEVTVESSRSILSTVAGGTITAASIVFSLTLVAVQLAASQFSPRVLRGFLGDRFQQLVMGAVVGTFSYSLMVLREVRSRPEGVDDPFLPQLSVAVAVVLAVISLVAILASIDHTAKGLQVGSVADGICADTMAVIERLLERRPSGNGESALVFDAPTTAPAPSLGGAGSLEVQPPDDAHVIVAPRTGWVTGIQTERLLETLPGGTTILVTAAVGTYVVNQSPIAHVWPDSEEALGEEALGSLIDALPETVLIEKARTMQQDISFGMLQLNDIALRALSPGVNDPNTANEVIVRLGAVVTELYRRELPPIEQRTDGRRLLRSSDPNYDDYVRQAFEQVRRYGRSDPQVLEVLIRTIRAVIEDARRRLGADTDVGPLLEQLTILRSELDELATDADRQQVITALTVG